MASKACWCTVNGCKSRTERILNNCHFHQSFDFIEFGEYLRHPNTRAPCSRCLANKALEILFLLKWLLLTVL